jgi:NTE family protein
VETATLEARYRPASKREGLAICLSGGGYRAALFHAGVLRRLNELGILSGARTLSSVSGGSIANALLASVWRKLTPDGQRVFTNFKDAFEAPLRAFCARDIRTGPLLWRRLDPLNWPRLASPTFSATDFLAEEYRDHLVGSVKLADLPSQPRFVFCAANLQTGVNFEFSADSIGDYVLGHTRPKEMTVADAVAASSSFPVVFPPLVRDFQPGAFSGGDPKALPTGLHLTGRVSLTDGGVYDNMGLEPAWKSHETVLVSDGGTPFFVRRDAKSSLIPRLFRSYQVIANQAEAVRKRWLIAAFLRKAYRGAYWGLGTDKEEYLSPPEVPELPGYTGTVLDELRTVRTDLDRFRPGEQSVLMNHGWALANAAMSRWGQGLGTNTSPGEPPDGALLEPRAALAALAESSSFKCFGH